MIGVIEDETWGKQGGDKKIITASSKNCDPRWAFRDSILDRVENEYWKIEVGDFQSYMYGFSKFIGIWRTTQLDAEHILVEYTYELYTKDVLLYPFHWVIVKTYWRVYMKRVVEKVRKLVNQEEPYLYY